MTILFILQYEFSIIQLIYLLNIFFWIFKHANEDVERMILGNKSDMEDRRVVSKAKGEAVSDLFKVLSWNLQYF